MDRHRSDVCYICLELRWKQNASVDAQRGRTCHGQADQHGEEDFQVGHPEIRCHRKGLLNVQRRSANMDANRYRLTRRRTGLLADHVGKDLFHWLTHRRCDDPLVTGMKNTNPKMRIQRGSQIHQSDQIWHHYGSSSVICPLTLIFPET